jgi:hypothetical protein
MEKELKIDVTALDAPHRRALEEVLGQPLKANQRLLISVTDTQAPEPETAPPPQTLEDWTRVYDPLSEEEIEEIDAIAKTRAHLTRNLG